MQVVHTTFSDYSQKLTQYLIIIEKHSYRSKVTQINWGRNRDCHYN